MLTATQSALFILVLSSMGSRVALNGPTHNIGQAYSIIVPSMHYRGKVRMFGYTYSGANTLAWKQANV